jgi:hypothetical protein
MQTPFEMAWLILKGRTRYDGAKVPQREILDIEPVALNDRGLTYLEEGQMHSTTPTVLNYLKNKSRQIRGEPPSESYADKIKRLMAEEEARSTYQDLPPPSNTFDLGNMEPYTKLGQPSSPPTPSV